MAKNKGHYKERARTFEECKKERRSQNYLTNEDYEMSRLDDEYLMAVVRNRSGIDSGEIDYSIPIQKFERQDLGSLGEIMHTLDVLKNRCLERIDEVKRCDHDWVKDEASRLDVSYCSKCHWRKYN